MTTSFLSDADNPNTPVPNQTGKNIPPNREPIKHTLIGSPKAVKSTIHYLQVIGYADAAAWSPPVPTPNSGEVISIMYDPTDFGAITVLNYPDLLPEGAHSRCT